jgi:DNA polymerase (family 10)
LEHIIIWGAALNYFTDSKEHNVLLRSYASKKGYKINEKGYWLKDGTRIGGETEKELYEILGLDYIPPEKREGSSELLKQLER